MALSAGSVFAILGARVDPSGFAAYGAALERAGAQAATAEAKVGRSAGSMDRASKQGGLLAGSMRKLVAAYGAKKVILDGVIGTTANFEKQMSKTSALGGQYAKRLGEMRKAALDLGTSTGVGAGKAAEAITELAKGGLSASQILSGGLKGAVALAQAGQMDLAEAASTTANALNLFGLSGDKATHVADAFANAANATTADVQFFAQGLAQGGLAAKNAGLDFDETTLALEAMAKAGFKSGSDAGTSLKTALTQLASPSDQAAESAKKMGLNFFTAAGSMKPLPAIAEMLQEKWGKLSDKQRLAAASSLVGQDGMRALLALYQTGGPALEKMASGLAKQGTAARTAAAQQDNLSGAWQRVKASAERLAITLGSPLQGPLKNFLNTFASGLNNLATGNFNAAADKILGTFTTILRAAQALAEGMGKLPGPLGAPFRAAAKEIDRVADSIDKTRERLRGDIKVKAVADVDAAQSALKKLQGSHMEPKVMKILGDDRTAKQKLAALKAIGIPDKTARVLANVGNALVGINSVKSALNTLQAYKRVVVDVVTNNIHNLTQTMPGRGSSSSAMPHGKAAAGHKTSGPEFILVGEGAGPEYVIPTEPKYRGRAIGLLMDAAQELGIAGHKGGTKKKGRGTPSHSSFQPHKIPAQISALALPVEDFEKRRGDAKSKLDKDKTSVHDLPEKIHDLNKRLKDTQGRKAKTAATKAKKARDLAEIRRDLAKRNAELKEAKEAEGRDRRAYRNWDEKWRAAKAFQARIDKQVSIANSARSQMDLANKRKDEPGFQAAQKRRLNALRALDSLYGQAKAKALTGAYERKRDEDIASNRTDIQDTVDELSTSAQEAEQAADEAADEYAQTGMTAEERERLAELDRDAALAALTEGLQDDKDAAQARLSFLEGVLQTDMNDRYTPPEAITSLAGMVKQAKDDLKSLNEPTASESAELQAKLDQERTARLKAEGDLRTQTAAWGVFQGAGDLGYAPTVNVYTLHPGDPATQRAIGDVATGGQGFQGYRPAFRESVGP